MADLARSLEENSEELFGNVQLETRRLLGGKEFRDLTEVRDFLLDEDVAEDSVGATMVGRFDENSDKFIEQNPSDNRTFVFDVSVGGEIKPVQITFGTGGKRGDKMVLKGVEELQKTS